MGPIQALTINFHPYYKWPAHESLIDRSLPPNPNRHVKKPIEQLIKFKIQRFPHSHFTTREPPDAVQYHPLYQGFRPLGDGSTNDLVDLTLNNPTFWPPEGQEWFVPVDNQPIHNDKQKVARLEATTVDDPFDTEDMLPYLSPSSLFTEEQTGVQRRMSSWGSYNDTTTNRNSLNQWQIGDTDMVQEPETPIATTSNEVCILPQPNLIDPPQSKMTSLAGYVIPKLPKAGILSNKVNKLAAKVSPQARPIVPKPPGLIEQSPRSLCNTSGLRPTQRHKKKK